MRKRNRIVMMLTVFLLCILFSMQVNAAVKISKKTETLLVGQTLQLEVTGTKSKIKWSSSKKSVATVNSKGKVTAKKKGTATITAKTGKKSYKCKITVKAPAVSLSAKSKTIYANNSFDLTIKNTKSSVKWSTSNKSVALIKKISKYKYRVTGKNAGTATITAKVGRKKYTCKVTVKNEAKQLFERKPECGNGTFYIYFASGTSENGKIPEVYVDKKIHFGYVDYCAYDINNSVPIRVYIDGKQVDIDYVGYKIQKSMSFYGDEMKSGIHTVEMVQYENNNTNGKIITYRKAKYKVLYR